MRKGIILIFSILSFSVFSQDFSWEKYKEVDGVVINHSLIECHNNELLTFEIINTNEYDIIISWHEEVWVDGFCKQNGESPEHFRSLYLESNQKVVGDCSFQESFYIGYKVKRGKKIKQLSHFDLKKINVIKK